MGLMVKGSLSNYPRRQRRHEAVRDPICNLGLTLRLPAANHLETRAMTGQNTSHAVMAQRLEPLDSLDDFPTPPWATRALCEHLIEAGQNLARKSVWEPACGQGYMARPLSEYFGAVYASDVHPYGYGEVCDFLSAAGLPHSLSMRSSPTRHSDWPSSLRVPPSSALRFLSPCSSARRSSRARAVTIASLGPMRQPSSCSSPSAFRWSRGDATRRRQQPPATPGSSGSLAPLLRRPSSSGYRPVGRSLSV